MAEEKTVAVVGLGYVGLPLALAFGAKMRTIGFDLSGEKVAAYERGVDPTGEVEPARFKAASKAVYTTDPSRLKDADFVVVAVPTPVDDAKRPDLSPVESASVAVGRALKRGALVIFESTVYPGVTEDVCVPILERESGMKCGVDFKVGYSPERINPGDKEHTLENIVKVVSAMDAESLERVAWLYGQVVKAGVYKASSIKVAESAKVIENTQRDLNIALVNELALIFHRLGIDTLEVLKAAGTKWNFLPFRPGLVGGHCIGVDPYYLTFMAERLGYNPQVILAGRRINDGMGAYVAQSAVKELIAADRAVKGAKVLIMGVTFKENVADVRNSKVQDIHAELVGFGVEPLVWDPVADPKAVKHEYGIDLVSIGALTKVDAVIAAVGHKEILALDPARLAKLAGPGAPFLDVKSAYDRAKLASLGFRVWRL
ncbi:MAG: nucleotide sugar dehydrogenase [Elusimicrobiota bacterium]|nr:MAG: nucleotide sugar dehydrogenase [Elusimicrobiota bacterium]